MRAIVLAAGYATRLRPLTDSIAKQLLPIGRRPMMDWVCDKVEEVTSDVHVVTNTRFVEDFRRWASRRGTGIVVHDDGTISNADRLGAIGDIAFVLDRVGLDDDVLVVAGDNLFDFSLADFVGFWSAKDVAGALAVYDCGDVELATHYGVVELGEDDRVVGFEEKPSEPRSTLVATATYLYHRDQLPLVAR
jgi:glucose-1-phosphate thymidylyltransferase